MAANTTFGRTGIIILFAIGLVTGCGGGSDGGNNAAPTTYADFTLDGIDPHSCNSLSLSANSGAPLDPIEITGIPLSFSAVAVYFEITGTGSASLYPATEPEEGTATFFVPVSPDLDPAGAAGTIIVTDGVHHCPAQAFLIDPLPGATREFAAYASDLETEMRRTIDLMARLHGSGYDALAGMAEPPRSALSMLHLSVQILEQHLAVTAGAVAAKDTDLLLRLMQKAQVLEGFTEAADNIEQWLDSYGPLVATAASAMPIYAVASATTGGECTILDPWDIPINSTRHLSDIMRNGFARTLSELGSNTSATMGFSSLAMTVAEAPTVAGDYLGILATTAQLVGDFGQATSPSSFISLTFDTETPLWEDKDLPRAKWSNAEAFVTSRPFSIRRAASEFAGSLLGAAPVFGIAYTVGSFVYAEQLERHFENMASDDHSECITLDSQTWGPFDVSNELWTNAEVVGDAVALITHDEYEPAHIGQAEIRVKIDGAQFGGATIDAGRHVAVDMKEVRILPTTALVTNLGETVEFMVNMLADHPEHYDYWIDPVLPLDNVSVTDRGDGEYSVSIKTSGSESGFPATFTFMSTSTEMPPNQPAREASATIVLGAAITINAPPSCVPTGQQIDLEAVLEGFADPDSHTVSWSATGGRVTAGSPTRLATYVANQPGTYTVRAETAGPNPEDPMLFHEIAIEVRDSCVRQYFTALVQSGALGDTACNTTNEDVYIHDEQRLGNPEATQIPQPEGPFWYTHEDSVSSETSLLLSEQVWQGNIATCAPIQEFGEAHVNIASDADGSANWDAGFTHRGACVQDDYGSYDGRTCEAGEGQYAVSHYVYIPVTEAGTWRFSVDLSCNLPPHYGQMIVNVARFIDSEGEPVLPNGNDSIPPSALPYVSPSQFMEFSCDGQTQSQSFTMDLTGPLGVSGEDLVTVSYGTGPSGYIQPTDPRYLQNLQSLDIGQQGDTVDIQNNMNVSTRIERLD